LDGETDWKVREAVAMTQAIGNKSQESLLSDPGYVQADPPNKEIYDFKGTYYASKTSFEPLRLKNTMWANTVLAAGEAIGLVIYTGKETRMQMNARSPRTKIGKTDEEINRLSMFLFCFVLILALILLVISGNVGSGFGGATIYLFKNILLLSSIIPISLRVNIDFAKLVYSIRIGADPRMEGTIVRNMSIPEELGRIEYLLSDKTGTLTKNEMVFKRLSTVLTNFGQDGLGTLKEFINEDIKHNQTVGGHAKEGKKKTKYNTIRELITAIMVCHNVTPVEDNGER
jgi:phospholipid-translocating ATPase